MRSYSQSTGWSGHVQDFVAGLLQQYLPLRSFGRCCPVATQLAVLLFAAVRRVSLSAACAFLQRAPSDETMRQALHAWLPTIDALERRLNAACCYRLPRALRKRRRVWAIDLVELPYYGQPWQQACEVRSGKPKQGTSRFHAYASLYVVHRGERFTLALTYVWAGERLADVVERLLKRAENRGIFPKFLLLDRQFYSLDVVARLKHRGTPFLLPVVHRAQAQGPFARRGHGDF
jgi:putative transposase